MIVYFLSAAPDFEIADYVGETPFAYFLAVGADYGIDVDQTDAITHFHMFFAMLALQSEFEFDGGGLFDDEAVGGYFLEAVDWFAFGNGQNREDMLLVAM